MNKIVISGVDKRKILDLGKEILLRDKDYQFQNISVTYFEKDNLIEVFIPFNRSNMRVFLNNVFQKFSISIESGNGRIEEELFVFPNPCFNLSKKPIIPPFNIYLYFISLKPQKINTISRFLKTFIFLKMP